MIQHSLHTTEVLLVSAGVELSGGSDRSDPVDLYIIEMFRSHIYLKELFPDTSLLSIMMYIRTAPNTSSVMTSTARVHEYY